MSIGRVLDFPRGRYEYSIILLTFGLIFLYWSQSIYFLLGNLGRLASLGLGFFCIGLSAVLRVGPRLYAYVGLYAVSSGYFGMLAALTYLQEHSLWSNPQVIIFWLVSISIFVFGFLLGWERKPRHHLPMQPVFSIIALISIFAFIAFLRYIRSEAFYGTDRGFDETGLNPVGVAYANTCLALIFITIALRSTNFIRKIFFLCVTCLGFIIVLSSASRGAVLWGAATLVFFLFLNRKTHHFSLRGLLVSAMAVIVLIPVVLYVYQTNYGFSERFDILVGRINEAVDHVFDPRVSDASAVIRQEMISFYIDNLEKWIIFGEFRQDGYPHNQFLEILVKFGLLGMPLLIWSLFTVCGLVRLSLSDERTPDFEFALVSTIFLFSYLQSMTSLSLQVNRGLWLGFGYIGAILVREYFSRRRSSINTRSPARSTNLTFDQMGRRNSIHAQKF